MKVERKQFLAHSWLNMNMIQQAISKTLNPQWREQFDFHMYEEQGGFVDITVWDKDAGKKDDFMGRSVRRFL